MTIHVYLFEAKSIQSYIFSTNKLKEIVGGSELIEQLTGAGGLVDQAIAGLGVTDIEFSRCGGAAFYAFSKSEASIQALADVWPLVFRQYAPDLEFIHAKGQEATYLKAFEKTHKQLLADRNQPKVRLPQANVYTRRFGRTGEPVVKWAHYGAARDKEPQDQVTARKLAFDKHTGLVERVAGKDDLSNAAQWPLNLTPEADNSGKNFPFVGQSRLIGLVHADGNGLGQLLMRLKEAIQVDKKTGKAGLPDEHYVTVFKGVSEAIKQATEQAARQAVHAILAPHKSAVTEQEPEGLYPARPIVLGGDDVTMIVRADLALPFTQAFLQAFEKTSRDALKRLKKSKELKKNSRLCAVIPNHLTACAGIVYAKSSQPFSLLHDLAEGLCSQAKTVSKANRVSVQEAGKTFKVVPSSVSFYRVTSSLVSSYAEILKAELTFHKTQLSRTCYTSFPHDNLPDLDKLLALQGVLKKTEGLRGGLRQMLGLLHQSPAQAQRRYERMSEVLSEREPQAQDWNHFLSLMSELSLSKDEDGEVIAYGGFDVEQVQELPLEDVLCLLAVENNLEGQGEAV